MAGIEEALQAAETPKEPARVLEHRQKLPAIIVDIDGTLAEKVTDREPYDWSRVHEDAIVEPIRKLICAYHLMHFQIIYLTGRDEAARHNTETWLNKYKCPPGPLLMAPAGSRAKSEIVKTALYHEFVEGKYDVEFSLEDRDKLVKMWRDLGVRCFQVANSAVGD